jgi:hypothetical protein
MKIPQNTIAISIGSAEAHFLANNHIHYMSNIAADYGTVRLPCIKTVPFKGTSQGEIK